MCKATVVIFFFVCGSAIARVPSYIHPCAVVTPECLQKAIQDAIPQFVKGIPEIGVNTTDPLRQESVMLDLAGGLRVELHNGSITGFRKCKVESAKYYEKTDEADLNLKCNLTLKGKYKAVGRLLIVSLNGNGDAKLKANNIFVKSKIRFQNVERDGVVYYEVKSYSVDNSYGDKVTFSLTNLFQGNPQISEAVLTFINANWKPVVDEFGGPVVDTIVNLVFRNIKNFFKAIPKSEIYPN